MTLMALFQHDCVVLCPEKCPEILKFDCSEENFFTVPRPRFDVNLYEQVWFLDLRRN